MAYEQGEWIMRGLRRDDPARLHSPRELIERVNACGFLPLFRNGVPGFSVEEMTCPGVPTSRSMGLSRLRRCFS